MKKSNKKNSSQVYDVVYGSHAVIEMLKAKRRKLISIYTIKPLPKIWDKVKKHFPKRVANIQYVSKDALTRMAGSEEHNGIVALVSPFIFSKTIFDSKKKPFILLLDGIQDVRNLGAILRTAYCVGVDGVVICKKGGASISPAVFKTSAGLAEYLNIYQAPSINSAIFQLKQAGYNFYMSVLNNGKNALEVEYKSPICLVIGNEAVGISKEIAKKGELITLPQVRKDISYNASVATGILIFVAFHKSNLK
jgi:23S rRNA (guanosine2251-2'-O)-methyltransferase